MQAAQNWTDTAQGTALTFTTTSINATVATTRMTLDASGNLGIGTTTVPATGLLEVSNAALPLPFTQVTATTFANSGQGSLFVGRKARGTSAAPAAVQSGDILAGFLGRGYGATNFNGTGTAACSCQRPRPGRTTAQGTALNFNTTPTGTNTPATRMTIAADGNVGIGTTCAGGSRWRWSKETPGPVRRSVLRDTRDIKQRGTKHRAADGARNQSGADCRAGRRRAGGLRCDRLRCNRASATAVRDWCLRGGELDRHGAGSRSGFVARRRSDRMRRSATWSSCRAATSASASSRISRPSPTSCRSSATSASARPAPTAASRNFAGTGIAGTCSSDRRFKKDITPFGQVLDQLTALQPVHYFWRAAEFPDAAFRRQPRLRPDRAGCRAGAARTRRDRRRRVQGGRLQQAAAAHHPGRQGTEGGERRA